MIHAYSKYYANRAMIVLGSFLDIGVNVLNKDIEELWSLFMNSEYSKKFERGDPSVVSGMTGTEIAVTLCGVEYEYDPKYFVGYFEEYWAGWALAYFQWHHNVSFKEIFSHITITDIVNMYHPYHEMDLEHFVDRMAKICELDSKPTKLKTIRKQKGFTQEKLAIFAEMSLRTLQQYEQRQKSINKASAETVYLLAKALDVKVEDILE